MDIITARGMAKLLGACILVIFTSSAQAEYYLVYTAPPCGSCYKAPSHKHKVHKKKHHYVKKYKKPHSSYSVTTYYAWQPVPACSCGAPCVQAAARPCCGQWVPLRKQSHHRVSHNPYYYS